MPKHGHTKRKLLLQGIVQGQTLTQAGKNAGYRSLQNAHDAFRSMVARLAPMMDSIGLTEEYLLLKLKNGISADRQEWAQYKGAYTDVVEVPDNPTRLKALETALRLRRMFPSAEEDSAKPTVAVQIITNVKLDTP